MRDLTVKTSVRSFFLVGDRKDTRDAPHKWAYHMRVWNVVPGRARRGVRRVKAGTTLVFVVGVVEAEEMRDDELYASRWAARRELSRQLDAFADGSLGDGTAARNEAIAAEAWARVAAEADGCVLVPFGFRAVDVVDEADLALHAKEALPHASRSPAPSAPVELVPYCKKDGVLVIAESDAPARVEEMPRPSIDAAARAPGIGGKMRRVLVVALSLTLGFAASTAA